MQEQHVRTLRPTNRPSRAASLLPVALVSIGFGLWLTLRRRKSAEASPALLAPGWREGVRHVNGVDLHVVEAGEEGAPLLLLLHGFPEFWWAWRKQITPLAEAGFHVVVPDLRGYDRSATPEGIAPYQLDTLRDDVLALADSYGAERFHLVGHDWGAVISWWVAATAPARLHGVVVMNGPHPDVWAGQAAKHPTQILRSSYVGFFQLPWLPEAALGALDFAGLRAMMSASARREAFEAGALDRYAEAWAQPGSLSAMLNYYRALRQRTPPPVPARIVAPVLVLWGADDSFLEPHIADASVALCESGTLTMVKGASHWLHLEQPARVNAEILAFFERVAAG